MHFFLYKGKKLVYNNIIKLKREFNNDIAKVTDRASDGEVANRQKQKGVGVYRCGATQGTRVGV